ncbi:MAG: shikimate kinase [Flavobacteriaceae bacterium]
MKIVILGYMACGKTFIASKLASNLKIIHIDLDDYIEEKENLSIAELFKTKGEIYFRKIETKYLKEILVQEKEFILSVGGGTPCYGDNIQLIKDNSISIYLKASPLVLFSNLINEKEKRPLVSSLKDDELKEFIAKHLFERNFYYLQADHYVEVDKSRKTSKEVVEEIVSYIIP